MCNKTTEYARAFSKEIDEACLWLVFLSHPSVDAHETTAGDVVRIWKLGVNL